jgi:hypothetical protein
MSSRLGRHGRASPASAIFMLWTLLHSARECHTRREASLAAPNCATTASGPKLEIPFLDCHTQASDGCQSPRSFLGF